MKSTGTLGPLPGRSNLHRASCFLWPLSLSSLLWGHSLPHSLGSWTGAGSSKGVWLLCPGFPRPCQAPLSPCLFLPSCSRPSSPSLPVCIVSWGPRGTPRGNGSKLSPWSRGQPSWGGTGGRPPAEGYEGCSRAVSGTQVGLGVFTSSGCGSILAGDHLGRIPGTCGHVESCNIPRGSSLLWTF